MDYVATSVVRSGISAGINSAVYGGSFGNAFKNGLIADASAAAANGIGLNSDPYSPANVLGHALLGCAAASLGGNACAAGAIGGATSALVAPTIGSALGIETDADRADKTNAAVVAALSTLAGGAVAAALGQNAAVAANAAANEALNNYLSPKDRNAYEKAKADYSPANPDACARARIYEEHDKSSNQILVDGLTHCQGTDCQNLANWIQNQQSAFGCDATGSADCAVLAKAWGIAQAKAQGLEMPTISPDDLLQLGPVLAKAGLAVTLKALAVGGMKIVGTEAAEIAAKDLIVKELGLTGEKATASAANIEAGSTRKLIGSTNGLTSAEQGFVNEMVAGGKTVEIIPATNAGRSADFLIDGTKYELKTMSNVANQTSDGLSKSLSSTIMDARGQSGNIIVDARGQAGMTPDIAQRGIIRAFGNDNTSGSLIQGVTVITSQGTVFIPRKL
ncbi:filamentous hemagglutinin [Collimonas sp. PA-H2]|uniref:DUF637 domain-containing protein n=1 Tax=Collimonas sp. PA-H2 TaxID=1881062 RepID=UPI000BF985CF|nr:DUF637 domain-containing protein [Collimonas sp. PA-H2]PFH10124.1 filamentous hemagglutinin [Collimonas sp. PA-H2]